VNRWLPNLKGIGNTFKTNSFDLTKVIFKEYNATALWTFGATLLLAYNTYWFNRDFSLNEEGKCFLIAIAVLLSLYFVVRFLKKRRSRLNRLAKERESAK